MVTKAEYPDHTALRVALWRALHLELDAKPPIFFDDIGAQLVGDPHWRQRPDMSPEFSKSMRTSIVTRARFIEDLIELEIKNGAQQIVILGAGLDTFAQRRPDLASHIHVFEIDQPETQKWKQERLQTLGYMIPEWLTFVPVDFEQNQSWWTQLLGCGFNPQLPTVVVSTGVSMYLSKDANMATLKQLTRLASGSTLAMTFMLSLDLLESQEKSIMEFVMRKAAEAHTPFLSLYSPQEIVAAALNAGFPNAQSISADDLFKRYLAQRKDGLNAGKAEAFLVCRT